MLLYLSLVLAQTLGTYKLEWELHQTMSGPELRTQKHVLKKESRADGRDLRYTRTQMGQTTVVAFEGGKYVSYYIEKGQRKPTHFDEQTLKDMYVAMDSKWERDPPRVMQPEYRTVAGIRCQREQQDTKDGEQAFRSYFWWAADKKLRAKLPYLERHEYRLVHGKPELWYKITTVKATMGK
jgi:hypothetical protein